MLEERRLVFVHLVEVEAVAVVLVADHLEAQGARLVLQRAIGIEQACRGERFGACRRERRTEPVRGRSWNLSS